MALARRGGGYHTRSASSGSIHTFRKNSVALMLSMTPVSELRSQIYSDRDHRGVWTGDEYSTLLREFVLIRGVDCTDKVTMLLFGVCGMSTMPSFVQHIGDPKINEVINHRLVAEKAKRMAESKKGLSLVATMVESNSTESSSDRIYPMVLHRKYGLPLQLFQCEKFRLGDYLSRLVQVRRKKERLLQLAKDTRNDCTGARKLMIESYRNESIGVAAADIHRLRDFVKRQRALLAEHRKVVSQRRNDLEKACKQMREYCEQHEIQDAAFLELYERYNFDRRALNIFDRRLKLRHHKMCRQLIHIFPIGIIHATYGVDSGSYRVRSLHIDSSLESLLNTAGRGGAEEYQMTAALSYIAHLTLLLSSAAEREGRKRKDDAAYPLYSDGVPKVKFRRGLELLSEDISQLAIQCKIRDYSPTDFIRNIRTVLYSMALARF